MASKLLEGLKSHSNSQGHEARTNGCLEEHAANRRRRVADLNENNFQPLIVNMKISCRSQWK